MKKLVIAGSVLIALVLLVPTMLVVGFSKDEPGLSTYKSEESSMLRTMTTGDTDGEVPIVSVYRSEKEVIEEVPFEEYIVGVVAREMPASFEIEALKAQALTDRTYILNLLMFGSSIKTPDGADVTDTVDHQ